MASIKKLMDPHGILNPYKVLPHSIVSYSWDKVCLFCFIFFLILNFHTCVWSFTPEKGLQICFWSFCELRQLKYGMTGHFFIFSMITIDPKKEICKILQIKNFTCYSTQKANYMCTQGERIILFIFTLKVSPIFKKKDILLLFLGLSPATSNWTSNWGKEIKYSHTLLLLLY